MKLTKIKAALMSTTLLLGSVAAPQVMGLEINANGMFVRDMCQDRQGCFKAANAHAQVTGTLKQVGGLFASYWELTIQVPEFGINQSVSLQESHDGGGGPGYHQWGRIDVYPEANTALLEGGVHFDNCSHNDDGGDQFQQCDNYDINMKMYVTLDTLGGYIVADQHMNTSGAHANWNLVAPVQIYMDGQAPVRPIEGSDDSVFGLVSDAAGSSDNGSDITVNDDDSSDSDNGGTSISVDDGSGSSDTGSSGGGTAINVVSGN